LAVNSDEQPQTDGVERAHLVEVDHQIVGPGDAEEIGQLGPHGRGR